MRSDVPGADFGGRIWVIGVVVVGLVAASAVGCDRARTQAVRQLKEGIKLAQEGDWSGATDKMEQAAETDPDYAKPHYQLGQIYETEYTVGDNLEKAERHYREALSIKPKNVEYNYKFGRLLVEMKKYEDAIDRLEKVVRLDENHAKAYFRMGRAYRTIGKHADAIDALEKAIRTEPRMRMTPEDPGGAHYHTLGNLYLDYGFNDKALKVYENGIRNNEKSARLYLGKGIAELELGRYKEAAKSFEKARKIDNRGEYAVSNSVVMFNLAAARQKAGQYDRAKKVLDRFVQIAGGSEGNTARLAAAQGMLEEIEEKRSSSDGDE